MKPESSLPCSQSSLMEHNLSQMNPAHILPVYLPKIHLNIILHLHLDLPSSYFPSGFPTKIFTHFYFLSFVLRGKPISCPLIWQCWQWLMKSTVDLVQPPVTYSCQVQIFTSAPRSRTPSICEGNREQGVYVLFIIIIIINIVPVTPQGHRASKLFSIGLCYLSRMCFYMKV